MRLRVTSSEINILFSTSKLQSNVTTVLYLWNLYFRSQNVIIYKIPDAVVCLSILPAVSKHFALGQKSEIWHREDSQVDWNFGENNSQFPSPHYSNNRPPTVRYRENTFHWTSKLKFGINIRGQVRISEMIKQFLLPS